MPNSGLRPRPPAYPSRPGNGLHPQEDIPGGGRVSVRVEHGDCREVIKGIEDCSLDSCVTDPPYSLVSIQKRFGKPGSAPAKGDGPTGVYKRASAGFMGAAWDVGDTSHDPEFWAEVYRVLKPGAHLVAFGGTRTYHRMVCAIEDAGFEIRDMLVWHYGTGFPKSHDVSKSIDKAARGVPHGGADPTLPNHGQYKTSKTEGKRTEGDTGQGFGAGPGQFMAKGKPVRRPRPGADQNKDGSWEKLEDRVYQPHDYVPGTPEAQEWAGWGTALKPASEPIVLARKPLSEPTIAANVLKWGTGAINIDGCRIGTDGGITRHTVNGKPGTWDQNRSTGEVTINGGRWPANLVLSWPDDEYELHPNVTAAQRAELYRWLSENP